MKYDMSYESQELRRNTIAVLTILGILLALTVNHWIGDPKMDARLLKMEKRYIEKIRSAIPEELGAKFKRNGP